MGYNDAQDALIKAFKGSETINKKALYLFFLKENTTHSDIKGHMPFNRQFGFVYAANQSITELTRTMAHELGHGAFRLKHTFSNENEFVQDQGQTLNLMDYASGSELLKYQWDECHDFDLGCNWFEDGDEAEILDKNYFSDENNYKKFLKDYNELKKIPLFNKVYNIVNKPTNISYCYMEKDPNVEKDANGYATSLAENIDNATGIIRYVRNKKTGEKVPFNQYCNTVDKTKFAKAEDWKGFICLDMDKINKKTIFHELNHAAQFILVKNEGAQYSQATTEVETRIILFYAAFMQADEKTRKDYSKMEQFLLNYYGVELATDLYPMVGNYYIDRNKMMTEIENERYKENGKIYMRSELYSIIYNYITDSKKNNKLNIEKFNKLMKDYAIWLKNIPKSTYDYDVELFKANFYLFNKVR